MIIIDKNNKKSLSSLESTLKNQGKDSSIKSDVNGSYTGLTIDGENPVQDADDL